jgi:hypothetical protein
MSAEARLRSSLIGFLSLILSPKHSPRVLQRSIFSSSHTCYGGGTAIGRQVDHKDEARFQCRTPGSHLVKGQVSGSVIVDDVEQGIELVRETSWGLLTEPLGEGIIGAIRRGRLVDERCEEEKCETLSLGRQPR